MPDPFDVRVYLHKTTHRLSNLLTLREYPKSKVVFEIYGDRKAKVSGLHTPVQVLNFPRSKQCQRTENSS